MNASSMPMDEGGRAPKVSVVVPTFRRAALLKETVDSILAQTFTDFELIIVDNMSEDGTSEYVMAIADQRVRYFRNPNHGVIAVNRNVGIGKATGKYIAFCDDDDLWHPSKLEKQVALLDNDPAISLCYSNATSFGTSGVIESRMVHKKVFVDHYRHLLVGNVIINSTVILHRSLFSEFGLLSEARHHIAVEDYSMWLTIAKKHRLAYIDEALILYRIHGAGNSANMVQMARKSLKVIVGEYPKNRMSPFYAYTLTRAFLRVAYKTIAK